MDFSSYSYSCKSEAQDENQQTEMLVALLFIGQLCSFCSSGSDNASYQTETSCCMFSTT